MAKKLGWIAFDIILMLFLAWQLQRYIALRFPSQIHYYCPKTLLEECAGDLG
jgi:hypothetical protein